MTKLTREQLDELERDTGPWGLTVQRGELAALIAMARRALELEENKAHRDEAVHLLGVVLAGALGDADAPSDEAYDTRLRAWYAQQIQVELAAAMKRSRE